MWEVESEGRIMKIRPATSSLIHSDNGWLVMERQNALQLAQTIQDARSQEVLMGYEEGEDG